MYKVYCENYNPSTYAYSSTLIHDSGSPNKEAHLINPKLDLKDLAAGEFSMTIPPYNAGYGVVRRLTSTISVEKDGDIIWSGRIISDSYDFWNNRTCRVEGALGYLSDSLTLISKIWTASTTTSTTGTIQWMPTQARTVQQALRSLLIMHNSKARLDRVIFLGIVDVYDEMEQSGYDYETNNNSVLLEIKNNITDRLFGHVRIRYATLGSAGINPANYGVSGAHLHADRKYPILDFLDEENLKVAKQSVDFGVNLLDFTKNFDMSNLCTVIYPRGKQLEDDDTYGMTQYVTVETAKNRTDSISNSPYIYSMAYNTYGRIERIVDFPDCELPNELYLLGVAYLNSQQFDEMNITAKAIDLHRLVDGVESIDFLDRVRCVSEPHGLDKEFVLSELVISLDKPEDNTYSFGASVSGSISSTVNSNYHSSMKSIRALTSTGRMLELAKEEATQIITNKTTGYVNIVDSEDFTQALVISTHPDWTTSNTYWIFNMNGLAFMNRHKDWTGIEFNPKKETNIQIGSTNYGRAELAITADGTIVADRIKTGLLSDTYGLNYWNLETGEFSLHSVNPSATIGNSEVTVYDLAYTADEAYNKKTGAANYLNGTKTWKSWRKSGGWSIENDEAICTSKSSVSNWNDMIRSPDKNIAYTEVKGYVMSFSFELISADAWGTISSTNTIIVSFSLMNGVGTRIGKIDKGFTADTIWSRRYVSVIMLDSEFETVNEPDSNYTGRGTTAQRYVEIRIYNRSRHRISIRRLQFERGNTPTDWTISRKDQDEEAQNKANEAANTATHNASKLVAASFSETTSYIKRISDQDREFTSSQRKALDQSLNQYEILKRLTNNFAAQGIYMKDKNLYINGTYIKTGTLDAGIVKAGILIDKAGKNKWNLVSGYFETNSAIFNKARASGSFETGPLTAGHMLLENAQLSYYYENTRYGVICGGHALLERNGREKRGMIIEAKDYLEIVAPNILVSTSPNYAGRSAYTGSFDINFIAAVYDNGDGGIVTHPGSITINVVNGLITNIWRSGI